MPSLQINSNKLFTTPPQIPYTHTLTHTHIHWREAIKKARLECRLHSYSYSYSHSYMYVIWVLYIQNCVICKSRAAEREQCRDEGSRWDVGNSCVCHINLMSTERNVENVEWLWNDGWLPFISRCPCSLVLGPPSVVRFARSRLIMLFVCPDAYQKAHSSTPTSCRRLCLDLRLFCVSSRLIIVSDLMCTLMWNIANLAFCCWKIVLYCIVGRALGYVTPRHILSLINVLTVLWFQLWFWSICWLKPCV